MKGNQAERRQAWQRRIEEQEESGISVRAYCKQHGIPEHAFYAWRQRVRASNEEISFALVKTKPPKEEWAPIELLSSGERLRIPCEEAVLGMVLRVLRAQQCFVCRRACAFICAQRRAIWAVASTACMA